jgi:glycosyltransferase involved in cell wall biosynthesis
MKLTLLTHPTSLESSSMPRFARYIGEGMKSRGHEVEYWTSQNWFGKLPVKSNFVRKWLGYIDQFAIFPRELRKRVRKTPDDHLFVVMDQALGMWVPCLESRPTVIHCMDLLALRSALGEFPENPTSWTGKQYQRLIRTGFSQGRHFLSISKSTQDDLHRLLGVATASSEVVYIGFNSHFATISRNEAIDVLTPHLFPADSNGFLMHVGGNQWYKNRAGVIAIYREWCQMTSNPIPLWMIGSPPTKILLSIAKDVPNGGQVRFLVGLTDHEVCAAYNLTNLLLYPSLEEGFGWPVAEAMACGALVLTTGRAPMTEVGGDAVEYHSRLTIGNEKEWAVEGAQMIESLLTLSDTERQRRRELGFKQARKFDTESTLDLYEQHYRRILACYGVK